MQSNTTTLKEALAILDAKEQCTLTYITHDKNRNTGGEIRTVEHCVQVGYDYKRATRLIKRDGKKQPKLVSIWLITHINGNRIID